MPWTPWRSTSSATRKASTIEVDLSSTDRSREFGITMSVSTSRQLLDALLGLRAAARTLERERLRHDADGQRADLARDAPTMGAAPVPVPPPEPAVMNTMSEPLR